MAHRRPCGIGGGLAFVAEAVHVPQARPQAGKPHDDGRCARRDRADLAHEDGDGAASEGPHLFDHEMGHRADLHRKQPGKRRRRGSSTAGRHTPYAVGGPFFLRLRLCRAAAVTAPAAPSTRATGSVPAMAPKAPAIPRPAPIFAPTTAPMVPPAACGHLDPLLALVGHHYLISAYPLILEPYRSLGSVSNSAHSAW